MAEYNKLSEVTYNPKVRYWRFRVKLHRIYPLYSYVTNSGPYYNYILTDEDAYAFRDGLDHMSAEGRRQVIVVLKMWRVWEFMNYFGPPDIWLETEGGFAEFRFNLRLPEVEEFRQSLLNSDPYVQNYGVEGLL
ncbi:hypothetical protein Bca52824_034711 [Brassica carinata]|uniref:Uncharacterized protein n=1 Tax=Brassica carinata TaxID=52824 RepID=A0A8X7S6A2_BRACI|nr:hypothetical protein Bca52824_034711 [Brassica carinata]